MIPMQHLSVRVPWHDSGWEGTVCQHPTLNGSCLKLKRIAKNRKDEAEEKVAGQSLQDLTEALRPICVPENVSFMAPYEYSRKSIHPYKNSATETHGHLAPILGPFYFLSSVPDTPMGNHLFLDESGK